MDSESTESESFASLWFFFEFLVNCDKCIVVKRLTKCLALFEHLPCKVNSFYKEPIAFFAYF